MLSCAPKTQALRNADRQSDPGLPVVVLPDLPRAVLLDADGRCLRVPMEHVWRPMCGSAPGALSGVELMGMAIDASFNDSVAGGPASASAGGTPRGKENLDKGGTVGGTLTIVFDIDSSVPNPARNALDLVEAFFEQQFADPITIVINVEFESLPPGVLGATGTPYVHVPWSVSRDGLQNGMDATDVIQNFLPSGSKIPVRYNGLTDIVTQESRVFWSLANFRAAIGSVAGDVGTMRFNDSIAWDYNPDNGVSGFSFVDVVIHEIGHVLGFDSGADFRFKDMEALDIFRFQRTDGSGGADYNPDTYAEFTARPRLVSNNTPNNDANSDIVIAEYKMADGVPYQASHFRDQQPPIGIMDPVMAQGESFEPGFLRTADKRMFDAIGWDR